MHPENWQWRAEPAPKPLQEAPTIPGGQRPAAVVAMAELAAGAVAAYSRGSGQDCLRFLADASTMAHDLLRAGELQEGKAL